MKKQFGKLPKSQKDQIEAQYNKMSSRDLMNECHVGSDEPRRYTVAVEICREFENAG